MSIADYGFAIWETFYVTVLSTAFALVLGLRKRGGKNRHIERFPNGKAIICNTHSPVTSSTVTPGWLRI